MIMPLSSSYTLTPLSMSYLKYSIEALCLRVFLTPIAYNSMKLINKPRKQRHTKIKKYIPSII